MSKPERHVDDGRPDNLQRGLVRADPAEGAVRPRVSERTGVRQPGADVSGDAPYRVWTYHNSLEADYRRAGRWNYIFELSFSNLDGLVDALERSSPGLAGKIEKLGILVHGSLQHGSIEIGPTLDYRVLRDNQTVRSAIHRLRWYLRRDATVVLLACTAGAGRAGTLFLEELSRLLPGRTVVGFVTFGYVNRTFGRVNVDTLLDTLRSNELVSADAVTGAYPRLNERRPSAKVARNGTIVRWPDHSRLWDDVQRADPELTATITNAALAERPPMLPQAFYRDRYLSIGR